MSFVEYFAIGSMMNPVSLRMRDVNPIKSRPGILKGYELIFVTVNGWAAARQCKSNIRQASAEIHGVLHTITRDSMNELDKLESSYVKGKHVSIELYQYDDLDEEGFCGMKGGLSVVN